MVNRGRKEPHACLSGNFNAVHVARARRAVYAQQIGQSSAGERRRGRIALQTLAQTTIDGAHGLAPLAHVALKPVVM